MTAYSDLLTDPRWQRRRLEILERDGFKCRVCERGDSSLHVHHGYYQRGVEPWDYPAESLWTLCQDCHGATEAAMLEIRRFIGHLNPSVILTAARAVHWSLEALEPAEVRPHRVAGGEETYTLEQAQERIELLRVVKVED